MKLYQWLMSKILSPGAYAVWHAMGAPEEWGWDGDRTELVHKTTVRVELHLWWKVGDTCNPLTVIIFPLILLILVLSYLASSFTAMPKGPFEGSIGWIDQGLIAGRALRLRKALIKRKTISSRQQRNMDLFTKLTINQVAE